MGPSNNEAENYWDQLREGAVQTACGAQRWLWVVRIESEMLWLLQEK